MDSNTVLKTFETEVDLKRTIPSRPFEVVDGDTGNILTVTVTDGGEAVTLTDCHIMAVFSHSSGVSVQDSEDGSIVIDGNDVIITLSPASCSPGVVECELQIYSSSETLVTTARFNFLCRSAIMNEDALAATPQFPLLTQLSSSIEAAEASRVSAENARVLAESSRVTAENARASAESARVSAESARLLHESSRQSNESSRVSAENTRVSNENSRVSAESARAQAETARTQAESARVSAESTRQTNESARASAESTRALNENTRQSNESARGTAESTRQSNESARVTAENARAAAEAIRVSNNQQIMNAVSSVGLGVNTVSNAPTGNTYEDAGRIYLVESSGRAYICTESHTSGESLPNIWKCFGYDAPWTTIKTFQMAAASSGFTVDRDEGNSEFEYDELRITIVGGMNNTTSANIFVNSLTLPFRDTLFANKSCANATDSMTILHLKKEDNNFISFYRLLGGVSDSESYASCKQVNAGFMSVSSFTGFSSIRVTGVSFGAAFMAGTLVTVEGRNV